MNAGWLGKFGLVVSLIAMIVLQGCAWVEENPKTARGAGIGAAAGAVGGAVTQGRKGAVWGTVLGALAGAGIGAYMDNQDKSAEETESTHEYNPNQGARLEVVQFEADPQNVRPGEEVKLRVQYAVMLPDNRQSVTVTEKRVIRFAGRQVADASVQVTRQPGTYTSIVPIALPDSAERGQYESEITVQTEGETDRMISAFSVQ